MLKNESLKLTTAQFAKLHKINKRTLHYYDEIDYILFILICIEVFVWFLLVYETLNNRLRLLIISRSYK